MDRSRAYLVAICAVALVIVYWQHRVHYNINYNSVNASSNSPDVFWEPTSSKYINLRGRLYNLERIAKDNQLSEIDLSEIIDISVSRDTYPASLRALAINIVSSNSNSERFRAALRSIARNPYDRQNSSGLVAFAAICGLKKMEDTEYNSIETEWLDFVQKNKEFSIEVKRVLLSVPAS